MTEGIGELRDRIHLFAQERRWDRLHTHKDLAMAIGIEAAELQEIFLWIPKEDEERLVGQRQEELELELADIFIYCLALADRLGVDLIEVATRKMTLNEKRFPVSEDETSES